LGTGESRISEIVYKSEIVKRDFLQIRVARYYCLSVWKASAIFICVYLIVQRQKKVQKAA